MKNGSLEQPLKHVEAIEACLALTREARRAKLGAFDTLDIGGGFPIDYTQPVPEISRFCAPIRKALARLPRGLRVIAEPGRYIAGPAAIVVSFGVIIWVLFPLLQKDSST